MVNSYIPQKKETNTQQRNGERIVNLQFPKAEKQIAKNIDIDV